MRDDFSRKYKNRLSKRKLTSKESSHTNVSPTSMAQSPVERLLQASAGHPSKGSSIGPTKADNLQVRLLVLVLDLMVTLPVAVVP